MDRFLVVDDSQSWRSYHIDNLKDIYKSEIFIDEAESARAGYQLVYNNIDSPYDVIITDLSMEYDFAPQFAGEWLIEQIKLLKQYYKTEIIIISGSMQIKNVAETFGVNYIPKAVVAKDKTIYQKFNSRKSKLDY
ncbi:response regulator [bacterium]|nr:response regulator [bacterium]